MKIQVLANEPITPSQVFLGDIFGANLCLPKNIPKKYPPPSQAKHTKTTASNVKIPLTIAK
jgi:hypothetical protein